MVLEISWMDCSCCGAIAFCTAKGHDCKNVLPAGLLSFDPTTVDCVRSGTRKPQGAKHTLVLGSDFVVRQMAPQRGLEPFRPGRKISTNAIGYPLSPPPLLTPWQNDAGIPITLPGHATLVTWCSSRAPLQLFGCC